MDALRRSRKDLRLSARQLEAAGHGPCPLGCALHFYYTTLKATGEYAALAAELKAKAERDWVS